MARKKRKKARPDQCGADTRKGTPCTRTLGWGTQHPGVGRCKNHGGSEPHAQVNGLVVLARREAAVMGVPLDIQPGDAILECIRISAGEVAYASERIAALEESEAAGPLTSRMVRRIPMDADDDEAPGEQLLSEVRYGPPQLNIWILARRQAMDRLVLYSAAAIKAGIQERLVRIAESQGRLIAQAIGGVLRELGVEQGKETAAIVRKHLTLVAGQRA